MPFLINEDQSRFIQCMQTQDNIRGTPHTIEYIKKEKLEAVLLSMDTEKAFDSVGWEFLHKVTEKFGFHKKFTESIKTLYTAPIARINVNGSLSGTVHPHRGCCQGCLARAL